METKICSKCKIEKEVCEFYKHSRNPNIYRGQCKKCMNKNSQINYITNKNEILKQNKEYRLKNFEKIKKRKKIYLEKNPNLFKEWVTKNKEHRKKYINEYNSDSKNKIKNSLRSRVNQYMNKRFNNPRTLDVVGCDYNFLIEYIESKFTEGMTWDNYGYYGWHLDHIIPLSSAKTEEEIRKLYHYTNLQPLWAKDNLKKGNKILI